MRSRCAAQFWVRSSSREDERRAGGETAAVGPVTFLQRGWRRQAPSSTTSSCTTSSSASLRFRRVLCLNASCRYTPTDLNLTAP
ncbi:hypothetical protein Z043_103955 [Scleropages formosus]|uniref:Uncharacterized protein n=1 Tax=Scleropages formosus TaxID=113540 RepID=A0A0N8K241_SCLFO|nr:hypothetical protein Z043_103955 [Scleropages formosus]